MARKKAKTIVVEGQLAWCQHLFNPDDYNGKEFWKVTLYPTPESIQVMKDAGVQARAKYDEEERSGISGKFYTFRRDTVLFDKDAEPPLVTIQGEEVDDDSPLIGNGSKARVKLEVYKTKNWGNGTRLVAVNVTDLIEYIPPEDEDETQEDEDSDDKPTKGKQENKKSTTSKKTSTKKADW